MKRFVLNQRIVFSRYAGLSCLLALAVTMSACMTARGVERKQLDHLTHLRDIYGASGAAFSTDGNLLAVGTGKMVYVWDVASAELLLRLPFAWESGFIRTKSIVFIDEIHLLTAAQGVVRLWNARSGLVIDKIELESRKQIPLATAWSEATRTLALSIDNASHALKLVELGKNGFGTVTEIQTINRLPRALQFSRDGRYLAVAGDGEGVLILDVMNGEIVGELPTRGFVDELVLFGRHELLVAGEDVALWSFLGEQSEFALDPPSLEGQVTSQVMTKVAGTVAFGILGVLSGLVGSSGTGDAFLGAIEVSQLPVAREKQQWCGRSTTICPDGKLLADIYPGITKEVIRIFRLDDSGYLRSLNPSGEFSCVAKFSPDCRSLLVTTDKAVTIFETSSWHRRDFDAH